MRLIVRTLPQRVEFQAYLAARLPAVEWCVDQKRNAMDTYLRSLDMAGTEPCVNMEDDIILTQGFEAKLLAAIAERPGDVIQFFSMRKADADMGSRYDRRYMMAQCTYYPAGFARDLKAYYAIWPQRELHPTGNDVMLADFLKARRQPYWIQVPSLVQHRDCKSAIDPRRSTKRQSPTFRDPWL